MDDNELVYGLVYCHKIVSWFEMNDMLQCWWQKFTYIFRFRKFVARDVLKIVDVRKELHVHDSEDNLKIKQTNCLVFRILHWLVFELE